MRLRLRLFLLLSGFALLLVLCQALLVRSLAERLDRDVDKVAVTVGEEILSGFTLVTEDLRPGPDGVLREIVAFRTSGDIAPGAPDAARAPAAGGTTMQWEQRYALKARAPEPGGDGSARPQERFESETIVQLGDPAGISLEPGREGGFLSELGEVARGLAHTLRNPLNALGLAVERLGGLAREVALEAVQDAGGRVRIDVVAPDRLELAAVEAELKAVLQALVVNACEASPDGGRVVVRVAAGDGGVRFEVDDEGTGVAPEIAPRLFAPHVTTKPQGSGMGLYLAQRLAQTRYGGGGALAPRSDGRRGTRATLAVAA